MDKEIELDCGDFKMFVNLAGNGGCITSNLREDCDEVGDYDFLRAADVIESLVLAHACAGVDIESASYKKGLETSVTAISNNL